jgi:hypothetical protein
MSSYNVFQQVFGLSLASNAAMNLTGTESDIQNALQAKLPDLLKLVGEAWEVAWGPVVWKNEPDNLLTGPDNAWYIAHNPAVTFEDGKPYNTYVIALAGSATTHDWLVEDFDVLYLVDFPAWIAAGVNAAPIPVKVVNPSGTYISMGTAGGIYTLRTKAPPAGAAGAGLPIYKFLASVPIDSKIIFAGHSLGGTLAPTLALNLVLTNVFRQPRNVLAYPTAGSSPGNGNFVKLYSSWFPPTVGSGYHVWNKNIINTLDIVPQTWCTDKNLFPAQNLQNIPTIYGAPGMLLVWITIEEVVALVNTSGIIYNPIPSSAFTGTPIPNPPTTLTAFAADAGKQHVNEYEKFFGVIPPPTASMLVGNGVAKQTEAQRCLRYPVVNIIAKKAARTEMIPYKG